MTVITDTLIDGAGQPAAGKTFTIRLNVGGHVTSTSKHVIREVSVTTNASGVWSLDLQANSLIDPPNTYYTITYPLFGTPETVAFVVPAAGGPYWLHDVLVTGPIPGSPANLFPASMTDGQGVVWSASLGQFIATAPTGNAEIAAASNVSGTSQQATANGGVGAAVVITGTSITPPNSNGRPVTLHWRASFTQVTAGQGSVYLSVRKNGVATVSAIDNLPNSTNGALQTISLVDQYSIGATTGVDTYALQFLLFAVAANTPAVNVLNSATGPSMLRAVAG